ncbi:MAG: hypothetical protein R2854_29540 [Caldilineaceae bacterium]
MERLGEVNYYVHEKRNVPLIVTDDDISSTFTFCATGGLRLQPRPHPGADRADVAQLSHRKSAPCSGGAAWATPPNTRRTCA